VDEDDEAVGKHASAAATAWAALDMSIVVLYVCGRVLAGEGLRGCLGGGAWHIPATKSLCDVLFWAAQLTCSS
jgi:hypothetical protein